MWGGTGYAAIPAGTTIVSIHPPRVGRDSQYSDKITAAIQFQSTLPVWGGTVTGVLADALNWSGFNPPSPCGEGLQKFTKILFKLLR